MPCAKTLIPGFEEELESRKVQRPVSFEQRAKGCGFILLLLPLFIVGGVLFKFAVVGAVALLVKYLFGQSWGTAIMAGVFVFLFLQGISLLMDTPVVEKWWKTVKERRLKARL